MKKLYTFIFFLVASSLFAGDGSGKADPQLKTRVDQWIAKQPVEFIENKGQLLDMNYRPVPFVLFKAEARGLDMYITEKGLTYVFLDIEEDEEYDSHGEESEHEEILIKWARVDMDLKGAHIRKENIITEGVSEPVKHYYSGHCPDGIRDVHAYKKITVKDVYPNIDWVLYNSNEQGFKYDFIVRPGADPEQIRLLYRSQKKLRLDEGGNINIKTPYGTLTENAPECRLENTNNKIDSRFEKTAFTPPH